MQGIIIQTEHKENIRRNVEEIQITGVDLI